MRKKFTAVCVSVCMVTILFGSTRIYAANTNQMSVSTEQESNDRKEEKGLDEQELEADVLADEYEENQFGDTVSESEKSEIQQEKSETKEEKVEKGEEANEGIIDDKDVCIGIEGEPKPYEINPYARASTIPGTWIQSANGRWWYRHNNGTYTKNGWEYINGKWYYFDAEGWMVTGWINLSNTWYYLNANGAMATGWYAVGGKWYYSDASGAMQVNWIILNKKWYYLGGDGARRTGWQQIDGKWYYFKINSPNSGIMLTGWRNVKYLNYYSGNPYYNYFNSNGAFVTDSDYKGCNHGYPTFEDYRYTISPKKVKYYSKCSKDQNEEIAKGAAAWSNDMAQVTKASKSSEANMFYYPVRFSQKEVLARTSYNINGSWTTNRTGNWKSTRIQVDNDRGIIKSGVIAHEIGHAFGLSHRITNKNSIMCQTQYGRKVQTVQNTDWETFKHIYGY